MCILCICYHTLSFLGRHGFIGSCVVLRQVVQKTAATFAPRASTATKNPAVPGTVLYTVFEVQGYVSLLLGGALSFNLLFPSNEPDIWRLMGMWSIWMFSKQYFIHIKIFAEFFLLLAWIYFIESLVYVW